MPSEAWEERNTHSRAARETTSLVPVWSFRAVSYSFSPAVSGPAAMTASVIALFIAPGATALASTPCGFSSSASVSVNRTSSVFAAP